MRALPPVQGKCLLWSILSICPDVGSQIRCDNDQSGRTCRRCAASGYHCDYNADYKRVSKKRKIQELVNEVQYLRTAVESTGGNHIPSPSRTHASVQSPVISHFEAVQQRNPSPSRSIQDGVRALASPSVTPSSSARQEWRQEHNGAQLDRILGNVAVLGTESTRLFAK